MGKITFGPSRFRRLPNGIYRARLIRIEEGMGKYEKPVYEPWFEILTEPHRHSELKDIINKEGANAKNSKLCQMIRALRPDFNVVEFAEIELDELIGLACYIKTEWRKEKNIGITQYFALTVLEDIDRGSA